MAILQTLVPGYPIEGAQQVMDPLFGSGAASARNHKAIGANANPQECPGADYRRVGRWRQGHTVPHAYHAACGHEADLNLTSSYIVTHGDHDVGRGARKTSKQPLRRSLQAPWAGPLSGGAIRHEDPAGARPSEATIEAAPSGAVRQVECAHSLAADEVLCGSNCRGLVERDAQHHGLGGAAREGSRWLRHLGVRHQRPDSVCGKVIGDPGVHAFDVAPRITGIRREVGHAQQCPILPAFHVRPRPVYVAGPNGRRRFSRRPQDDSTPSGPERYVGSQAFEIRARSDRKSTRLNSSHGYISYAVFCLKKKKIKT